MLRVSLRVCDALTLAVALTLGLCEGVGLGEQTVFCAVTPIPA